MTLAFAPDTVEAPTFAACPTWCTKHDAHDPYGELDHGAVLPRLHEVELFRGEVASHLHLTPVQMSVTVSRLDDPDDGADEPTITLVAYERVDGNVVSIGISPTVDEARALIAALTAAVDAVEATA